MMDGGGREAVSDAIVTPSVRMKRSDEITECTVINAIQNMKIRGVF